MAEAAVAPETQALESTTVGIYRTATVVKGGRRFSFAALVVVGDRNGSVGIGYGKAPGVPAAIEKAQKDARKQLFRISLHQGTLPHPVRGRHGASRVLLQPAAPGTGVIASGTVRAVLEMSGVNDCLTKCYGSTNKKNVAKAVINGLQGMRTKEAIASHRGVTLGKTEVEERIEAAQRFMAESAGEEAAASVETPGSEAGGEGEGGVQAQVKEEAKASTPSDQKPEQTQEKQPEAQNEQAEQSEQGGDEQKQEGA